MSERGSGIHVTGVVQGVGFRPFVYGLATRLGLAGWVRNTSAGVDIAVEGPAASVAAFEAALRAEAPPLARIDELTVADREPHGFTSFEIRHSRGDAGAFQPISPDVAVCDDCLREMRDPADRRHRYPFINCTNCGPRFTIIEDIPYDRPNTTMAGFPMCPDCAAEYRDPGDRRFHAQPVACPACGPRVWLERAGSGDVAGHESVADGQAAVEAARRLMVEGQMVAVKGLGGFHLACDATSPRAVAEMRRRKMRVGKPFALMLPDLEAVERHCIVGDAARTHLMSPARPIVLLPRRAGSTIAPEVAPGQARLGVFLPYSPLHHLLVEPGPGFPEALVMTSGNLSDEPIATGNDEARARLARLADAFLMNDRPIRTRCDDSVVTELAGAVYPVRRSRGYAPYPVRLPREARPLLAGGAELKNTFCLTRGRYAFLSHHIGDLENFETLQAFEDSVAHYERLFRVTPQALAYDRHPDYLATRYVLERSEREGLPAVGVQHHHAHVAACMAEHGLTGEEPVIGVVFDGTGYGDDGAIWGGEFLVADYAGFRRALHLAPVRLPGGDAAVREPWRVALAWLEAAGLEWSDDLPPVRAGTPEARRVIARQLALGLNAPLTTSMGRLFDAVAALAGVRVRVSYEAQAAIELEALVDPDERGAYPLPIDGEAVDARPAVLAVVRDVRAGVAPGHVAARFHNGVAAMVVDGCRAIRDRSGCATVALSGGVWQNVTLLALAVPALRAAGFHVLVHQQVPANDGGLALGQAAVALAGLERL